MRTALISTNFPINIIPTDMRYCMTKDMFERDGVKLCEISYEILAKKWIKTQEGVDENEEPTTEQIEVDFETPVLFDSAKKEIPYGLYLLIESYRNEPSPELLAQINGALSQFEFQYSLEGFVLQVSDIN